MAGFLKELTTTGKGMLQGVATAGRSVLPITQVLENHAEVWALNAADSAMLNRAQHLKDMEDAFLTLSEDGFDFTESSKLMDSIHAEHKASLLRRQTKPEPKLKAVK